MILKKPYAFLVKRFKIIHTVLLAFSIYLLVKTWDLCSFLGKYIDNNLRITGTKEVTSYISTFMIISTIIMIIAAGVILYLMRYKKKPIFFYLYTIILNVILLVAFFIMSNFLYGIQFETPDMRLVSIIKDVYYTLALAQAPIILFSFFRAIGFDVKKFDFKKDLMDLGIEEKDNEEYEVELNLDTEDIKAKARKRLRFIKYFYKENKILFVAIGGVLGLLALSFIVNGIINSEKLYKENQYFSTDLFKAKVLESYKFKDDSLGNEINGKNFYVVAKIRFNNKTNYSYYLNTDNIRLGYTDYDSVTPTTKQNEKLKEFGVNYYSQILYGKEERDFVFIFEVPNEYYDNDFVLKYLYDISSKNGETKYKYRSVDLSAKEFSKDKDKVDTKKLGEELSFEGSLLGNTTITIKDYKIADTFYYNVVTCKKGNCNKKTSSIKPDINQNVDFGLIRLNYDINYDYNKLGKNYYNDNFITQYGSIRFEINGTMYNNRFVLSNKTPYATDNYAFLEVRSKVAMADKIYLDFNIRDKVYTYVLKEKEETQEVTE